MSRQPIGQGLYLEFLRDFPSAWKITVAKHLRDLKIQSFARFGSNRGCFFLRYDALIARSPQQDKMQYVMF